MPAAPNAVCGRSSSRYRTLTSLCAHGGTPGSTVAGVSGAHRRPSPPGLRRPAPLAARGASPWSFRWVNMPFNVVFARAAGCVGAGGVRSRRKPLPRCGQRGWARKQAVGDTAFKGALLQQQKTLLPHRSGEKCMAWAAGLHQRFAVDDCRRRRAAMPWFSPAQEQLGCMQ